MSTGTRLRTPRSRVRNPDGRLAPSGAATAPPSPQAVNVGQAVGTHEAMRLESPLQTWLRHTFSGGNTSTVPAGERGPQGSEVNGDWQVLNGKLRAPGTGEAIYLWDIGKTRYTYEATVDNIAADPTLIVRGVDGSNFIGLVMVVGGSGIYQRVSGSYSAIQTGPAVTWAAGDRLKAEVTPTNVKFYRNGVLLVEADTTQFASATKVGFRTNGGGVDWDDAIAYTLPVRVGQASSTGVAMPVQAPAATLLAENGNGTAGALSTPQVGPAPTQYRGTYGRDGSGRFGCTSAAGEAAVFWDIGTHSGFALDVDVEVVGGDAGIVLYATDAVNNGRWLLVYLGGNYGIYAHNCGLGDYPLVAAGSGAAAAAGDHVRIEVAEGTTVMTVFVNGVQRSTWDFAAVAANVGETTVGFRENNAATNRYDNLIVTEL